MVWNKTSFTPCSAHVSPPVIALLDVSGKDRDGVDRDLPFCKVECVCPARSPHLSDEANRYHVPESAMSEHSLFYGVRPSADLADQSHTPRLLAEGCGGGVSDTQGVGMDVPASKILQVADEGGGLCAPLRRADRTRHLVAGRGGLSTPLGRPCPTRGSAVALPPRQNAAPVAVPLRHGPATAATVWAPPPLRGLRRHRRCCLSAWWPAATAWAPPPLRGLRLCAS